MCVLFSYELYRSSSDPSVELSSFVKFFSSRSLLALHHLSEASCHGIVVVAPVKEFNPVFLVEEEKVVHDFLAGNKPMVMPKEAEVVAVVSRERVAVRVTR